jgi:cytochrome c biogenesis protein CcdA
LASPQWCSGGILGAALLIVLPWGPDTVVWLLLAVAGATIFFALAGAAAQAITDVRRARRRRAGGNQL